MSAARRRAALAAILSLLAGAAGAQEGKPIYDHSCGMCHNGGLAGAPRRGASGDWAARLGAGREALYRNATQGVRGMPARGGNAGLTDAQVRAAVDHLISPVAAPVAAPVATPVAAPAAAPVAAPVAAPAKAAPAKPVRTAAVSLPEPGNGAADANAFNRLLKPLGKRNLPPLEDGIHDPAAEGTAQLQPPMSAFDAMPRANAGNGVDWVKSLELKRIAPRWERDKAEAAATPMDLNIVREVKGSMPDVVYPHRQHTQWLDCSNCHPAIFAPQKGANAMSMASILLGQGCGTCHGRVAFPVSECRLCHSRKKERP